MWRKLRILSKFELRQTWDDKAILFYTLICPAIYFVIADINSKGQPFGVHNISSQLLGYWVYIILVGVLNGFQFGLIGMRESNFLKMFTIIAGDKRLIFYSNLIVQIIFVQTEIVLFDIFVLVLNPSTLFLIPMMIGGFFLNFLLIPIVAGFTNFVLLLPLKVNLSSLLMMGYILLAMLIINLSYQLDSLVGTLLTVFTPSAYMIQFYSSGLNMLG
ncbi:hypothetical protein [Levilactobacillus sp. N40-8-2]|uniref:hypothetical protein n=1 Tax=Levilactobacillus muriae TaxID=3238987 RepID=UPI0038B3B9E5